MSTVVKIEKETKRGLKQTEKWNCCRKKRQAIKTFFQKEKKKKNWEKGKIKRGKDTTACLCD